MPPASHRRTFLGSLLASLFAAFGLRGGEVQVGREPTDGEICHAYVPVMLVKHGGDWLDFVQGVDASGHLCYLPTVEAWEALKRAEHAAHAPQGS